MSDTPSSTWVLLRGLTRCSAHWGDFPQALAQALPGARVVLLDLPGNGTLCQQTSPTTIAALVDFCRAELLAQGVAAPYHLLAMSMGAMVAAQWAHDVPQELAGAVLINTSFRPFSPFFRRLRPRNYARLLRVALPGTSTDAREQTVLRLTSNHPEQHAKALAQWRQIRQQPAPVAGRRPLSCHPPAPHLPRASAGQRAGRSGQCPMHPHHCAALACAPGTAPRRRPRPAAGRPAVGHRPDAPVAHSARQGLNAPLFP